MHCNATTRPQTKPAITVSINEPRRNTITRSFQVPYPICHVLLWYRKVCITVQFVSPVDGQSFNLFYFLLCAARKGNIQQFLSTWPPLPWRWTIWQSHSKSNRSIISLILQLLIQPPASHRTTMDGVCSIYEAHIDDDDVYRDEHQHAMHPRWPLLFSIHLQNKEKRKTKSEYRSRTLITRGGKDLKIGLLPYKHFQGNIDLWTKPRDPNSLAIWPPAKASPYFIYTNRDQGWY